MTTIGTRRISVSEREAEIGDQNEASGTLLSLATLALTNRRRLIAAGIVFGVAFALPALLKPRTYTSEATFAPQAASGEMSRMGSLALQLGIAVGNSAADSPEFYATLVRSREILSRVADRAYRADSTAASQPIGDLLGVSSDGPIPRQQRVVLQLRRLVAAQPTIRTGMVRVSVTAPTPWLAKELADSILSVVNQFNVNRRQTRASAEREFIESRLAAVRAELHSHEETLRAFLLQNRQLNSPSLTLVRDRLQQEVELRRALFTTLAQSYEQARIEEVRNISVISVIENPSLPASPDSRRILIKAAAGGILGVILMLLWSVSVERMRRRQASGDARATEFAAALRESLASFRFRRRETTPR